jgi:hypothetical protein
MKKVSEVLKGKLTGQIAEYIVLTKIWRAAVGVPIAAVAVPVKAEGDTLIVGVSDSLWLSELSYMKEEIIEKLTEGGLEVRDIRFVYRPAKRVEPVKAFIPRTPTERELRIVKNVCSVIKDQRLRERAESAMRAYFGKYSYDDFIES